MYQDESIIMKIFYPNPIVSFEIGRTFLHKPEFHKRQLARKSFCL